MIVNVNRYDQRLLEDLLLHTDVKLDDIDLEDKEVIKMFYTNIYGSCEYANHSLLGINECSSRVFNEIVTVANSQIRSIDDIISVLGLRWGSSTWIRNGRELLKSKTAKLSDLISTKDDVNDYLIRKGLSKTEVELVVDTIGQRIFPSRFAEVYSTLDKYNIPTWYVCSLSYVRNVWPRGAMKEVALLIYRLAWFKMYHTELFFEHLFKFDSEIDYKGIADKNRADIHVEFSEKYSDAVHRDDRWRDYNMERDLTQLRCTLILASSEL